MYSSPLETGDFSAAVPAFLVEIVMNFAMNWILWAGILLLVAKLFNEELGRWNVAFVIIGYSFIATVVYTLINLVPLSTLPPLNVPLDPVALNALLDATWRPLAAYQLWLFVPIFGEVWLAALGAVVVHTMREELPWSRAATIAAVAFALRFVLRMFLGF
jgi:ABC-type protease/lipase transport system fused ATPase/permease subunit